MKTGLASEALILAGSFLLYQGRELLGGAMISLGIVGGIINFLYFVSRASSRDSRKNLIYNDVRSLIALVNHTIGELGDQIDKKRKDSSTFH